MVESASICNRNITLVESHTNWLQMTEKNWLNLDGEMKQSSLIFKGKLFLIKSHADCLVCGRKNALIN